jgi:hypothetical protein
MWYVCNMPVLSQNSSNLGTCDRRYHMTINAPSVGQPSMATVPVTSLPIAFPTVLQQTKISHCLRIRAYWQVKRSLQILRACSRTCTKDHQSALPLAVSKRMVRGGEIEDCSSDSRHSSLDKLDREFLHVGGMMLAFPKPQPSYVSQLCKYQNICATVQ